MLYQIEYSSARVNDTGKHLNRKDVVWTIRLEIKYGLFDNWFKILGNIISGWLFMHDRILYEEFGETITLG